MPEEGLEGYLLPLERELRSLLRESEPLHFPLYGMMGYHLGWRDEGLSPIEAPTGKRVRPLLCLLAAEAAGGEWERALPAAAAVEILHNFSLVHDDVQDRSEMRRHRPAVWKLWGEAQAINVGDALFALAYLALQRLADLGVPPQTVNLATRSLSETCLALCQGQFLDLRFEGLEQVEEDDYLAMIRGKTAALIGYSTYVGALIASQDSRVADVYRRFGEELGIAFQLVDDLLGIWGKEEVTGKPSGDDIRAKKKTLPMIYAMGRGPRPVQTRMRRILTKARLTEEDVEAVKALLEEAGAEVYVREMADEYRERALRTLGETGCKGLAKEKFRRLALLMVRRDR